MKKYVSVTVKICLVIGIFYWLQAHGHFDLKNVADALTPSTTLSIFVCLGFAYFVSSERLRILLKIFSIQISRSHSFQFYLVGFFFNFFLPGGVGGDFMKAYYIYRHQDTNKKMVPIAVLADRLLGLFTIFFIASVAVVVDYVHVKEDPVLLRLAQFCILVTILSLLSALVLFLVDTRKIVDWARKYTPVFKSNIVSTISTAIHETFSSPKLVLQSFAFSMAAQISYMTGVTIAGHALGFSHIPIQGYFLIGSLGFLISAVPLTPAGIGIAQAAFLFVANAYLGTSTTLGPSISTIFQIISVIWGFLGGLVYVKLGPRTSEVAQQAPT